MINSISKSFWRLSRVFFSGLKTGIINFCTKSDNFNTLRVLSHLLILLPLFYIAIFSEIFSPLSFCVPSIIGCAYFFAFDVFSDMNYDICENSIMSKYWTSVVNTIVIFCIIYYSMLATINFSPYLAVLIFFYGSWYFTAFVYTDGSWYFTASVDTEDKRKNHKFCGAIILLHFRLDIILAVFIVALEAFIVSEYISLTEIMNVEKIALEKIKEGLAKDILSKIILKKNDKEKSEMIAEILDSIIDLVNKGICEKEFLAKVEADKKEALAKVERERLEKIEADKKEALAKVERERLAQIEANRLKAENAERERLAQIEANRLKAENARKLQVIRINGIITNINLWQKANGLLYILFNKAPEKSHYISVVIDETALWENQKLYEKKDEKFIGSICLKEFKKKNWYDENNNIIDFSNNRYFVKVLDIHN